MDRYVYSSVQEESSAAVLVQVHYICSHKLSSCKTAPVERPHDTIAIFLLLRKEHSSVSVLVAVRGATVDFRHPPVLCRMVIASPGSFAFWGCTTASGETCSYWSHTQSLNLKLSRTASYLTRLWPLHSVWALHAQGNWMLEAGGAIFYQLQLRRLCFPGKNGFVVHTLVRSLVQIWFKYRTNCNRTLSWRSVCALIG